jgi:hypothetical protein
MTDADTLDSPRPIEEAPPGFGWVRFLAQLLLHVRQLCASGSRRLKLFSSRSLDARCVDGLGHRRVCNVTMCGIIGRSDI